MVYEINKNSSISTDTDFGKKILNYYQNKYIYKSMGTDKSMSFCDCL